MIKKELMMKKNITEIILISYSIGTFLLAFLFWNNWELIWHEYFSLLTPKFTVFVVPVLLAFSSIYLISFSRKSKLGWIIGLLALFPIENILYMKNFVYIDRCPCSRLYPFLDTEIHFWINSVMFLIFLISIVIRFSNRYKPSNSTTT